MKQWPKELVVEKNVLATKSAWILLLEIHLTDDATILRYARHTLSVMFGGNTYQRANFKINQYGDVGKGELPQWRLQIANVARLLESYLEEQEGLIGATIKFIPVNSENLGVDYTNLEKEFEIIGCQDDADWISLTLGAPSPLRQRFPLYRYLPLHCRFYYESAECDYTRKTVADVILSGTDPVKIQVNSHSFDDGSYNRLADINGITPSLAGIWIITVVDANNFTLDGTDSSDYSGSYTSGGSAGYAYCKRNLKDCRERENATRFGGEPGMRTGGLRIAAT